MTDRPSTRARVAWLLVAAAAIVCAAWAFDNPKAMTLDCSLPFFSGAATWDAEHGWRISLADVERARALPAEARPAFRAEGGGELRSFTGNSIGYLFVTLAARTLLPWLGDAQALEVLQILVHVLLTLGIAALLPGRVAPLLWLVGYGLNPLVLHHATFPFYYFWQSVPSAAFLALVLVRRPPPWAVIAGAAVLGALLLVRPTVLLLVLLTLGLAARRCGWRTGLAALAVFATVAVGLQPAEQTKDPYFTAYVGFGAWPNERVHQLDDASGFALYEQATGRRLSTAIDGGLYDPVESARFRTLTRQAMLELAREEPVRLVRNAALNTLQGFGIGHIVGRPALNWATAALGLLVLGVLAWRRQWLAIAAIWAASATFVPYYPPIPAYLHGSYALLAFAGLRVAAQLGWLGRAEGWLDRLLARGSLPAWAGPATDFASLGGPGPAAATLGGEPGGATEARDRGAAAG